MRNRSIRSVKIVLNKIASLGMKIIFLVSLVTVLYVFFFQESFFSSEFLVAMHPLLFTAFPLFALYQNKCYGQTADQCPAQLPIYDKALKGYTFKTVVSSSAFDCLVHCHYEDRCQSYNYVIKTSICEMNNRTKEAKPEQFVSDPDRFYMKRGAHRSKAILIFN